MGLTKHLHLGDSDNVSETTIRLHLHANKLFYGLSEETLVKGHWPKIQQQKTSNAQ